MIIVMRSDLLDEIVSYITETHIFESTFSRVKAEATIKSMEII